MKINCIVIEDSPLATEKICGFINKAANLNLQKTFTHGVEALTFIKENKTDLVFLDIQMEEFNGIQFLESSTNLPMIIIVSAYDTYAIKGFEYSVVDYLLKPYSFERFLKAVEKAEQHQIQSKNYDFVFIKTDSKFEKVFFKEILYIEGNGAYLNITLKEKKIVTLMNFQSIESILPKVDFIRVHKSYIVAINKIDHIEKNMIVVGEKAIPLGGSYKDNFYSKIINQ